MLAASVDVESALLIVMPETAVLAETVAPLSMPLTDVTLPAASVVKLTFESVSPVIV